MKHSINSFFEVTVVLLLLVACKPNSPSPPSVTPTTTGYEDITVEEAKAILDSKNAHIVFLDVRTPEETASGMITGAREIDFRADGFSEKVAKLDKEKSYVVYCRSGGRSSDASKIMEGLGFKKVKNVVGGYNAWKEMK